MNIFAESNTMSQTNILVYMYTKKVDCEYSKWD